ncbi:CBO0543 family protein [Paenibacillus silvisoli]|uniref:CBO0543 family protein n=1 Tax=Paenibacillus silvisoli TaxID=3110539 RepID=UPI002804EE0F|nr:CBO0543 family protein [Paenibacillus silvisoli]
MALNVLIGFILPWLTVGLYLLKKDIRILVLMFPVGAMVSFATNLFGFHFELWNMKPFMNEEAYAALPYNFGTFPLLGCLMLHLIDRTRLHPIFWLIACSLCKTGLEGISVWVGRVTYDNGWNIGWTFVSYLAANLIGYAYFHLLRRVIVVK